MGLGLYLGLGPGLGLYLGLSLGLGLGLYLGLSLGLGLGLCLGLGLGLGLGIYNFPDKEMKMKKVPKQLTQIFDYKAAGLTVYEAPDGRLMVAELIGKHSGRIYEVAELFNYAENMKKKYDEENFVMKIDEKYRKEFRDIEEKLKNIAKAIDRHDILLERSPRLGWK